MQENDRPAIEDLLPELSWSGVDGIGSGFRQRLQAAVAYLLENDFEKLVRVLYRVDVSESKLKTAIREKNDTDAAEIIAGMLIERQMQKIKFREQFGKTGDSGEEEW